MATINQNFTTYFTLEFNATFLQNNSVEESRKETGTLHLITLVVCAVVLILGVVGNSLVVFLFGIKFSKLKSFEILMVNLAVADFLNALVAPTQNILELVRFNFQQIGINGCKIVSFTSITTMTVAALTLLTVSIDRFIVVKWPLHKRPYQRTIFVVIACIWLAAALMGSVYLIDGNVCLLSSKNNNVFECYSCMKKNDLTIFVLTVFVVQTGFPIMVMTVLYTLIVIELSKNAKSGVFEDVKRNLKIRLLQNRKATKMVVLVVGVFSICFLPVNLFYLWYLFHTQPIQEMKIVYDILTLLQMCNSIANPIIYSRLHSSFKQDITKLIFPCCVAIPNKKCRLVQDTIRSSIINNTSFHKNCSSSRASNGSSMKTRMSSITTIQYEADEGRKLSELTEDQSLLAKVKYAEILFFNENQKQRKKYSSHLLN